MSFTREHQVKVTPLNKPQLEQLLPIKAAGFAAISSSNSYSSYYYKRTISTSKYNSSGKMSVTSQDISLSSYTSNVSVGVSPQGHDFSLVGDNTKYVSSIVFCITPSGFGRIALEKRDGSCITIGGSDAGKKTTWTFGNEEKFTRIRLYSQPASGPNPSRLAGIRCSTTTQNLEVFCNPNEIPPNPVEIPVGTGRCAGVFGVSGVCVDSLGFAMCKN